MAKLRYCSRCKEIFTATGKHESICNKCSKKGAGKKPGPKSITGILGTKKWATSLYNTELEKKAHL